MVVGKLIAAVHRLLCFLRFRDEMDYAGPAWPEVNHEYSAHPTLNCCEHCAGGRFNPIHTPPFDPRRMDEIGRLKTQARYF